jgi:hypothetical protein
LQTDTYAKERFVRYNVSFERLKVASVGERCQAMSEVSDAREDDFLAQLSAAAQEVTP